MSKKILIVDDDPIVVRMVQSVLKNHDYEVVAASDGLDALVAVKNEKPQLVILDVMMPEINGYDVCYQLRFNKDYEKIPILLMTIRDQELDSGLGKRVNIAYLQKPIDGKMLVAKIEMLLGKTSG